MGLTWVVEKHHSFVYRVLKNIFYQWNMFDKTIKYVINYYNVLIRYVYSIFSIYHSCRDHTKGNRCFLVRNNRVKMKSTLTYNLRKIGQFWKPFKRYLGSSFNFVFDLQIKIWVDHKLVQVGQILRGITFSINLLRQIVLIILLSIVK